MIEISEKNLVQVCYRAMELLLANQHKSLLGLDNLSKMMANKLYGRDNINKWLVDKRIKPERLGTGKSSKLAFKVSELETCRIEDGINLL